MTDTGMADMLLELMEPAIGRIRERATRGRELEAWGLHPQPLSPGSSLARDDHGFAQELGDDSLVSATSMWPAMAATDNLAAVHRLFDRGDFPRKLYAPSTMNLCRTAMESAARVIWQLCPEDQDERRRRVLGVLATEFSDQKNFIAITKNAHDSGDMRLSDEAYADLLLHEKQFNDRFDFVKAADKVKVPSFREAITEADAWLSNHPAAHDDERMARGLAFGCKRFYNLGSGMVHGRNWVHDYASTPSALFKMMADGFGAAVFVTECAVALFEARAVDPAAPMTREPHYPDRLARTVGKWAALYS
ncbi:hypothetical protein [Rhodococcus rhodochrous]|uniref:hypothetical protein n=1 Tax=Rhodococcus rhodochrous TaxID=1829 RepID=UPI001E3DE334|nr:hypothetical protein [Rhodococcus rhodochrous]MCD2100392.1 hypothetical protein [Rhodococcus rhodochrous]MCD2124716.1 hypothetical protein [Rhodococcus rhodochrous]MCQ4138059.1 hypothetical protein [Rhodococcus rhodochrous]MDJ0021567.1 hypothetical protein [Rhodococcus rhodochrous]